MLVFGIIALALSVPLFIVGGMVYKGNTKIINDYDAGDAKDESAYCKALSRCHFTMAAACVIGGVLSLFQATGWAGPAVLAGGFTVGIVLYARAQKKYIHNH